MSTPTSPTKISRRQLIKNVSTVAIASPLIISSSALGLDEKAPASDRIGVALIGTGSMGNGDLSECASQSDVEVTALCDVWESRLESTGQRYPRAKRYHDYRELLADKNVDAVIIATPPHWHCLQAVDAVKAGKDIYLQKPMTLSLGESLAVRNAVQRHQRVCQVGTQVHAVENYRRCVELVRSGNLGKISNVYTFFFLNDGPGGIGTTPPDTPPAAGLDWDFFCGPCPKFPYSLRMYSDGYGHGWSMPIGGGWTCGMAPHIIDLPIWALELDYPESIFSTGGRFASTCDGDAPDTQEIIWKYPDRTMHWRMSTVNSFAGEFGSGTRARRLGIYFYGVNATMYADYDMHKVVAEGDYLTQTEPPEPYLPPSPGHRREWLDCIKTRKEPSCSPNYHCKVDIPLVLGNLSLKLGRSIQFDPKTQQIVGDPEAAKLSIPEYRDPWKFPSEYV